jgi:hypothetical protein
VAQLAVERVDGAVTVDRQQPVEPGGDLALGLAYLGRVVGTGASMAPAR